MLCAVGCSRPDYDACRAAALSEKVKDKPVGVDILGTRVVLFRDSQGKVKCLDDACPHR
jgi:phenylpropionate dioxygenase-like ring-hydroxylating dioxygenase large terminal subunit